MAGASCRRIMPSKNGTSKKAAGIAGSVLVLLGVLLEVLEMVLKNLFVMQCLSGA